MPSLLARATLPCVLAPLLLSSFNAAAANTLTLPTGVYQSFRGTTPGATTRYISQANAAGVAAVVDSSSSATARADATYKVIAGLGNATCYSLESRRYAGTYLRVLNGAIQRGGRDGTLQFDQAATWCAHPGLSGSGASFEALNSPGHYLRQQKGNLRVSADDGGSFKQDATWSVGGPWADGNGSNMSFLHAQGRQIVNASGVPVPLRGFNLGGWIVMEDFMSPMDATQPALPDTYSIKQTLDKKYGVDKERSLLRAYQDAWIAKTDIDNIAGAGYNVVRVPVWWGQFFDIAHPDISGFKSDGFDVLDQLVSNAAAKGVYVIIDMHGLIGGQSMNLSTGKQNSNTYWTDTQAQSMSAWLWWQIANHYKGNATVAGYDLMNEPDVHRSTQPWTTADKTRVWQAYDALYKSVREADPDHMIFIEDTFGNWDWDMLPAPSVYGWKNVVYEAHEYQWPAQGTQQTVAVAEGGVDHIVMDFNNHASWNVPGYVGEFNVFGAGKDAWRYSTGHYDAAGLSWTMWSYKSVNGVAPNYWGWYDVAKWVERPYVASDSPDEIERKWGLWLTSSIFAQNTALGLTP